MKSASKLGKEDAIPAISDKDDWRIKRLQMMAKVQATFLSEAETDAGAKSQKTLQSAKEFFTEWQSYPFCYGDIKEFVDGLSTEAQQDFLKHVSESSLKLTSPDAKKSAKVRNIVPLDLAIH